MDKNILQLILILFIVSILIKIYYSNDEIYSSTFYEFKNKKQNNAICFICRILEYKLLKFAEDCSIYNKVYIIVDDNNQQIIQDESSNVTIIKINNEECINNDYINSTWRFNLDVTGWDKAFYYFCKNNNYDNVWFIEDDVFIPKPYTLYNIDLKYGENDILIRGIDNVKNFESNDTAWLYKISEIQNLLPNKEIYWSWVCAMRCSNNLLQLIKLFKNNNKKLFFHELLIPTLVKNNNLNYKLIDELKNIIYRNEYNDDEIINNPTYLYHPMKDLNRNQKLRLKIQ